MAHLLQQGHSILSNQCHPLGTEYSNIWTYGVILIQTTLTHVPRDQTLKAAASVGKKDKSRCKISIASTPLKLINQRSKAWRALPLELFFSK